MTTLVVESALRSLLMAAVVWAGLKLLRVHHVLAQKIAWSLVLLVAFAMPLLMRWQAAHPGMALVVPVKQSAAVTALEKKMSSLHIERASVSASISRPVSSSPAAAETPSADTAIASAPNVSAIPVSVFQQGPAPARVWHLSDLARSIIPAYLVICGALLLRMFVGLVLAMRIWRQAEPASPILEPRATVRISSSIQSPVTIGSGIVLPANYTEWDRAKLRFVLAHERSHVRQRDFYLQLLASLYAALVWFSPLGWWLKRRLADLGEALSDRAALQEADDRSSYAEVLLEFAALPRHGFAGVTAGVGMARSSNIQRRIERILNDRSFRIAFLSGRRHAVIAALLIPCGLVLATSLLHVQAAETVKVKAIAAISPDTIPPDQDEDQAAEPAPTEPMPQRPQAVRAVAPLAQASPSPSAEPVPVSVPIPPVPSLPAIPALTASVPVNLEDGAHAMVAASQDYDQDSDRDNAFVFVDRDRNSAYANNSSWGYGGEADRIGKKISGSFIWFKRDGKSYVITDPALVAGVKALYARDGDFKGSQERLQAMQADLARQQARIGLQQSSVRVPVPDISKEMAELQQSVQTLAAGNAQEVTQRSLAEVQARLGALQARLAEAQALAGSRQAAIGPQESELGAKEAALGRQEAELGRQEARVSRDAAQRVNALIDRAFRDGKAKLVD